MSWRDNPLYVVEWAGGDRLPYTRRIYQRLAPAKKYLFEYMRTNQAEGYIQLHQPFGAGNIISIARQKNGGEVEIETWDNDEVTDVEFKYLDQEAL